ncbi:sulfite exporter TauE/SafE family protein [Christiangramia salexigens]|uniref:Probable membrane transporter protein n=1 Tax=Christiangramia salexigens TaxID=1913577 RepID=A0A1L3J3V4_9FLAO|nr:sulfite exporter TauE/SafE family protein [Christiangramia salexigens]APG59819.1 permease [Christiangramia salexigens]
MDMLEILGYFGALLIGLVLGLIGGGGSILTVPVMVYLMSVNPVTATAYSLFVVGSSSLVGAGRNLQKGLVGFKTAIIFAIPAVIAVFSTRKFLVPAIPDNILTISGFTLTKDIGIMLFFAVLMLLASVSMIIDKEKMLSDSHINKPTNHILLAFLGIFTGLITGLVGAGGGFIIIPILVLMAGLSMKKAVGTSLLIIAINSLIGFLGDLGHLKIDWMFLLIFTGLSVIGIFLGVYLNKFIHGEKLKKGFGWFVLVMGIYIIWKELS